LYTNTPRNKINKAKDPIEGVLSLILKYLTNGGVLIANVQGIKVKIILVLPYHNKNSFLNTKVTSKISKFKVKYYTSKDKNLWNSFIKTSKNATFLFQRDFMEYHSDRFVDSSMMIFKSEKLIAVLPANSEGNKVISHQGLTYGGIVLSKNSKFADALMVFREILALILFEVSQYCYPSDEMDYLLGILNSKNIRNDLSSAILLENGLKISSNRMEGVKKGRKAGLSIEENNNFRDFWNTILIPNLSNRHDAKPVHSVEEIEKLAAEFSENIHQFNVILNDEIVAGATIFETQQVAHVQYISANQDKQTLGSLDFLFHYLITERFSHKRYFDFGTSNENQGKNINEGLLYWKECFGARSVAHPFFEVKTSEFNKLDTVFI